MSYDADHPPAPEAWLARSEADRIAAIEAHHAGRADALHDAPPSSALHHRMHLVVENQAAEGLDSVTRTLERLTAEGLRRHAAIHMIMEVLTEALAAMATSQEPLGEEAYGAKLDALDASAWIGARMRRALGPVDL